MMTHRAYAMTLKEEDCTMVCKDLEPCALVCGQWFWDNFLEDVLDETYCRFGPIWTFVKLLDIKLYILNKINRLAAFLATISTRKHQFERRELFLTKNS